MTAILLITAAFLAEPRSWFDGDDSAPPIKRPAAAVAPAPPDEALFATTEEPVKTRPAVRLPSSFEAKPAPQPLLSGLQFKSNLPERLLQNAERKALFGLSPEWCTECWRAKKKFDHDTHPYIAVDWLTNEPPECPQYPAIYDPETQSYHIGDALESWGSLTKSLNTARKDAGLPPLNEPEPARMISVGTLDREALRIVMECLGNSGTMTRSDEDQTHQIGQFSVLVPGTMSAKWSTGNRSTRFSFGDKQPVISYGKIKTGVSFVTVTSDTMTIGLNWVPDVTIEIR